MIRHKLRKDTLLGLAPIAFLKIQYFVQEEITTWSSEIGEAWSAIQQVYGLRP